MEEKRQCSFFVKKRNRRCRLIPGKGKTFCGEHINCEPRNSDTMPLERIPCPYDPNHTVAVKQLPKHLKVCNSRPKDQLDYYQKGINAGDVGNGSDGQELRLASFSLDEIKDIIAKVEKAYKERVCQVETQILHHPALGAELANPENGAAARKHLLQLDSLLGHMTTLGLLSPNTCFVEFGAGRGRLSQWIQQALEDLSDTSFLLVDRAAVRHKRDAFYQRDKDSPRYERINMDIENLSLGKVPTVSQHPGRPIAAYTKHLCGGATDLALRCLMETSTREASNQKDVVDAAKEDHLARDSSSSDQKSEERPLVVNPVKGAVMALCCHHRCSWSMHVGKEFFSEIGISRREFSGLVRLSSWAVCGQRAPKTDGGKEGPAVKEGGEKAGGDAAGIRTDTQNSGTVSGNVEVEKQGDGPSMSADGGNDGGIEGQKMEDGRREAAVGKRGGITVNDNKAKKKRKDGDEEEEETEETHKYPVEQESLVSSLGLSVPEREELGFKCKRVLDMGRIIYLRSHGMDAKLVYYVERSISPENAVLIATPAVKTQQL